MASFNGASSELLFRLAVCLAEFDLLDAFRQHGGEVKILELAAEAPGVELSHVLRLAFLGDEVDDHAARNGRRVRLDPDLPIGATALKG